MFILFLAIIQFSAYGMEHSFEPAKQKIIKFRHKIDSVAAPSLAKIAACLPKHQEKVHCIKRLQVGEAVYPLINLRNKLITGGMRSIIEIRDPESDWRLVASMDNQSFAEILCGFGQHHFISSSDWKNIKLWDIETQQCIQKLSTDGDVLVDILQIDNKRVATIMEGENNIDIWDITSGEKTDSWQTKRMVTVLALGQEGQLLSGSEAGYVKQWDISMGKSIRTNKGPDYTDIRCLANCGQTLVSTYYTFMRTWDISTGKYIETLSSEPTFNITHVTGSKQGYAITTDQYGIMNVWDVKERRHVCSFFNQGISPDQAAIFESNKLVVGSSIYPIINVWDLSEVIE